jgi:site-specific DNA-methyltransferase (cytosine-N4-specific)
MTKYTDESWDFRSADTKTFTHCYHAYPAMMIPQVAERLLSKYGTQSRSLFDPYCGTGTSLVEANLKNIRAIGTDLNPLARLIATAKTSRLNLQVLDLYLREFNDYMFSVVFDLRQPAIVAPTVTNMDFWFDKPVQQHLSIIKNFIDTISDERVAMFFSVAFSETVRESSFTRKGEFKLFRMTAEQMQRFKPDVFGLMHSKLARNHKGLKAMLEAMSAHKHNAESQVYDFNSSDGIPFIEPESIDIVLTSPPYGDSRTTVAYGQFSRLANEWLGMGDANQVDNNLMGGKNNRTRTHTNTHARVHAAAPEPKPAASLSPSLHSSLERIAQADNKRADEVSVFYDDYQRSIHHVARTVKPSGYACYVVGNRKVKGEVLPTDEITKDFFEQEGLQHIETIIRAIPNKRMPSKNSPSNVSGAKDETMNNEYIVVMRKP